MAYGGVPSYIISGPQGEFFNYVRIDGLTLTDFVGSPSNIANGDTGQLTTAVPGPNQTGIPPQFGRGRGRWRAEDVNMVLDAFGLLIDPAGPPGFVVPATVIPSPEVIDGDLILTHQNIVASGVGALLLRAILTYQHPVQVYARGGGPLW